MARGVFTQARCCRNLLDSLMSRVPNSEDVAPSDQATMARHAAVFSFMFRLPHRRGVSAFRVSDCNADTPVRCVCVVLGLNSSIPDFVDGDAVGLPLVNEL